MARRLATVTAFGNAGLTDDEVRSRLKRGALAPERLPAADGAPADLAALIAGVSEQAGHADLLLLGVRTGDRLVFRLYGKLSPHPDLIEVPNVETSSLDFLATQIDNAARVPSRLATPHLALDLLETTRGLIVANDRRPAAEAQPPLPPGTLIRSVDQRAMDYSELQAHLRTRLPGQSVTLAISSGNDTSSFLAVPVRFAGSEYPWSAPDGPVNAVMAILNHLLERDPAGQASGFAALSLARGLMHQEEWKRALDMLGSAKLGPLRSGVCPGTVLYYQGRCYEELGDRGKALAQYTQAREYPEATLGTIDGIPIKESVERRIQTLKKSTQ